MTKCSTEGCDNEAIDDGEIDPLQVGVDMLGEIAPPIDSSWLKELQDKIHECAIWSVLKGNVNLPFQVMITPDIKVIKDRDGKDQYIIEGFRADTTMPDDIESESPETIEVVKSLAFNMMLMKHAEMNRSKTFSASFIDMLKELRSKAKTTEQQNTEQKEMDQEAAAHQ